jgi:hypothetical protein
LRCKDVFLHADPDTLALVRRFAIAFLSMAPAACGLAFSPGDYRESGEAAPGLGLDGSVNPNDAGPTPNEGAVDAGPARTRIALFAGRRDAVAGETSGINVAETMLTWIDADGNLGPFTFDAPPPVASQWTHAALIDGKIYVHTATGIAIAPFTDRVAGAWAVLPIPSPSAAQSGLRPWALNSRGLHSGRATGPESDPSAWFIAYDGDAGVGAWTTVAAQTAVVRGNTRLVKGGDNVYLVGGETPEFLSGTTSEIPAHSEVEVAKLDANGELGDFHATTALPEVGDAGAFATFDPVAVASADHLYLLGGLTASNVAGLTDVALGAKIKDATTGDLDSWTVLPKLPQPMNGFAAVITPSWLVVFGGQGHGDTATTVRATDVVLRLALHADGTFGSSWETAGHLPAARATIVGVTY